MNRSNLCKTLGVEPRELWEYDGFTFMVDEDGFINQLEFDKNGCVACIREPSSSMLCAMIIEPEKIKHKLRWTKKDIEGAKYIREKYPWATWVYRSNENEKELEVGCNEIIRCARVSRLLIPSVGICELVDLDEILKAEPKKYRWTEKDYADATWAILYFPNAKWVHRYEDGVYGWDSLGVQSRKFPSSSFLSLELGESVPLAEILEEGEKWGKLNSTQNW